MEAENIFVTVGTTDPAEPYRQVALQVFADSMVAAVLDREAENQKLLEMVTSLTATVERMQKEFDRIARELSSITKTAQVIMHSPKPKSGGLN